MSSVALCIVTYLRPVGLARLLDAIAALHLERSDARVRLVVVDNDPAASAKRVVEAARARHDFDVTYVVEARRGITYARNRALQVVLDESDGTDWVGWLDDDEAPRSNWLEHLLNTQALTNADVVAGPSEPIFESDAADWIIDAGAFGSDRFTTGETYPFFHTRTSGVIVRAAVIPAERFDNRLSLTGGEDRVFFTLIDRAGGTFIWDDRAVVDEWVPSSRVTVRWLARRWFRTGVTRSLTLVYLDQPSWSRRARRMLGGGAMAVRGLGETIMCVPHGRGAILVSSRRILLGIGASYGALGLRFREYHRTHGR